MDHYYSEKPAANPRPSTITYSLGMNQFTFTTSSSVFSRGHVDKGSELLIKESQIPEKAAILDIGCGYGAVGIIVSKLHPKSSITMTDINERALSLSKKNCEKNEVAAEIIKSNLFGNIDKTFDVILSNPPQHAGKQVCFQLIEESIEYVKDKGSLQLVARHQKGGKELAKKMKETYGNVETIARKSGFQVYKSVKK